TSHVDDGVNDHKERRPVAEGHHPPWRLNVFVEPPPAPTEAARAVALKFVSHSFPQHSGPMPRSIDSGTVSARPHRPQRPSCRTSSSSGIRPAARTLSQKYLAAFTLGASAVARDAFVRRNASRSIIPR